MEEINYDKINELVSDYLDKNPNEKPLTVEGLMNAQKKVGAINKELTEIAEKFGIDKNHPKYLEYMNAVYEKIVEEQEKNNNAKQVDENEIEEI